MAHTEGVSLLKGNSNESVVCSFASAVTNTLIGKAVKFSGGDPAQPEVAVIDGASDLLYGVVSKVNTISGAVVVNTSSLCMPVRVGASDLRSATGQVYVDVENGFVTDVSTDNCPVNGEFLAYTGKDVLNQIDGTELTNAAFIKFNR